MSKADFALIICGHYKREIETVLEAIGADDFHIHYLDSKKNCRLLNEDEMNLVETLSRDYKRSLVIGGVCVPRNIENKNIDFYHMTNCFSLFCPSSEIDELMEKGAYIVTSGWLEEWRDHLRHLGIDKKNSHYFFKDKLKEVVLLDTECYIGSEENLKEFADFISMPYKIKKIGIGYFQLLIAGKLEQLKLTSHLTEEKKKVSEQQRALSELNMSNDMLLQLVEITEEEGIIQKSQEIFKMLTGANTIVYVPGHCERVEQFKVFPGSLEFSYESILSDVQSMERDFCKKPSGAGFYIRLRLGKKIIGYLLIDEILMPQYIDHYISISPSISDVCALAISNAVSFTKIEKSNKELSLINQVMVMLHNRLDEVDEITEILRFLKDFTDAEDVGIRLKENNGYPYYANLGMDELFIKKENDILEYSDCLMENNELKCFCGSVINSRFPRKSRFFTDNGSFWLGDPEELSKYPDEIADINIRGTCVTVGYNSIALIPLETENETFGLIQFNDRRKNLFSNEDIIFLEKVCFSIGIALNKRKMRKDLERSKAVAEMANRSKSEFLANMSHEIRTPLNAIIGFSDLINNLTLTEKQKKYFNSINSAGQSLLTLINDILDLSKIEAGMLDLKYEEIDLREILNEIHTIFQLKVIQKDLNFIIDIDKDFPDSLFFDEVRIRQILLNLVGNAIKFTERGFIAIRVSILFVDKNTDTVNLSISIEDSGIGIKSDELESIFGEFKQESSLDSSLYGGTGLGLAIVKKLVERMDGNIFVESDEGRGSLFKVDFSNIKIGKNISIKKKSRKLDYTKIRFDSQKVLIVDDIESNRMMVKELLHEVNLVTAEASDGKEGLLITEEFRPDLILLDIRMPVMDGYEMIHELKKNNETKHIPVIALTASVNKDLHMLILRHGFHNFLYKPIDINELIQEIYWIFNNREILTEYKKSDSQSDILSNLERNQWKEYPREFTTYLKESLPSKIKNLTGAVLMTDVCTFGFELRNEAKKHGINDFDIYVDRLIDASDAFEMDIISFLLKGLGNIINDIPRGG